MKLNQAVAKRIKDLLKIKGLTQYQLFKLSGVPQSTISTILKGEIQTIKLSTLYNICAGLEIDLQEFFNAKYLKFCNLED